MEEKQISIKDYHYNLPFERIAKYPLTNRDESKLLIYKDHACQQSTYSAIKDYLPENALLFFNNTKVIPARLYFKTNTNKIIELFCLEPLSKNYDAYSELNATQTSTWKCIVGGASKWKDSFVSLVSDNLTITAVMLERHNDTFTIQFNWEPQHLTFAEVLQIAGSLPIPPYLKRATETIDLERYQTVYAQHKGSVAAPTAGLHFTDAVLESLKEKNISANYITLHVGAGTFKPVKSETMEGHDMHREFIDVSIETIESILNSPEQLIIAVGTTSLRTLESLYWIGVKVHLNNDLKPTELNVEQWEPYELIKHDVTLNQSLKSLTDYLKKHDLTKLYAQTGILIVPGYQFKVVKALVTNFHQPESTLILLVAAFIGQAWQKVYQYALNNDFRFLSYGDGSLLYRVE